MRWQDRMQREMRAEPRGGGPGWEVVWRVGVGWGGGCGGWAQYSPVASRTVKSVKFITCEAKAHIAR
jgi:hypothetical protein